LNIKKDNKVTEIKSIESKILTPQKKKINGLNIKMQIGKLKKHYENSENKWNNF